MCLKLTTIVTCCGLVALTRTHAENIPDLFLHSGQSLNGEWKSIIDPYKTGFYDYRLDQRDKNRASIIIWSLANETPVSEPRTQFLTKLAARARSLDSTRLISAAMEKHSKPGADNVNVVEDPLAEVVDVVAFNQYVGWYDGLPDKCQKVTWEIPYDKPVFISEFGAGARQGLHGSKDQRWTEEFQDDLYQQTLPMLDKIDGLAGFTPWILVDFRSPRRPLPGIQDGFNRKGLISSEGVKKKAYSTLQEYYRKRAAAP